MKHREEEAYSVAWFKLADLVVRGEKERALGVYRLLSHSIEDEALSYQLEGDLLWSFDDTIASERYKRAASLYAATNRFVQAAAIYEHLHAIEPINTVYLSHLQHFYNVLGNEVKFLQSIKKLYAVWIAEKKYDSINESMQCILQSIQAQEEQKLLIYIQLFLFCVQTYQSEYQMQVMLQEHLMFALGVFFETSNQFILQQLLIQLELVAPQYHKKAIEYLENCSLL